MNFKKLHIRAVLICSLNFNKTREELPPLLPLAPLERLKSNLTLCPLKENSRYSWAIQSLSTHRKYRPKSGKMGMEKRQSHLLRWSASQLPTKERRG